MYGYYIHYIWQVTPLLILCVSRLESKSLYGHVSVKLNISIRCIFVSRNANKLTPLCVIAEREHKSYIKWLRVLIIGC